MKPITFLLASTLGLLMATSLSCDENPRQAEQQPEEQRESPQPVSPEEAPEPSGQAGEEGSELAQYTGPLMEQCVAVVGRVRHCTTENQFNEILLGDGDAGGVAGWTQEELSRKTEFWSEAGAQRQACEDLVAADRVNPFKVGDQLDQMANATNEQCVDFGELLRELGALEALANVEI